MSKENKARKGCKDVFNAFLVSDASYDGLFEIPSLSPTYDIPNQLIAFPGRVLLKILINGFIFTRMTIFLNRFGEIRRSTLKG